MGNGYKVEEHLVGRNKSINSNHYFHPLFHGMGTDTVGWWKVVNGNKESMPLPVNRYLTFMQTFTAEYMGHYYRLSSRFEHVDQALNGKATNLVKVIVP